MEKSRGVFVSFSSSSALSWRLAGKVLCCSAVAAATAAKAGHFDSWLDACVSAAAPVPDAVHLAVSSQEFWQGLQQYLLQTVACCFMQPPRLQLHVSLGSSSIRQPSVMLKSNDV